MPDVPLLSPVPTPEERADERRKFDRHLTYVYFHLGTLMVGLGIILSAVPNSSAVSDLSWDTQQMLGLCMLFGSGSALLGVAMGSGRFLRDTLEHPLDLRYPYAFALGGLVAVGISMWAYFIVILMNSTVIGTLGGGLSLFFGIMAIHLGKRFACQIVVRTRMRNVLTRRAVRERDHEEEPLP